jgi:uncharacterized protein YndB with AHSA1/START domain
MTATSKANTRSVTMEYDLPHAPAKVWRALTDPELVSKWLMKSDMTSNVGAKFTFTAKPMGSWDGTVRCEILESVPHKKLSYTWQSGPPENMVDTIVTWTLTPTSDGGTKLSIVHSGFLPKDSDTYDAVNGGWRGNIDAKLRAVLAAL